MTLFPGGDGFFPGNNSIEIPRGTAYLEIAL